MKQFIRKGILFIGLTCAFQANAAIIQIDEALISGGSGSPQFVAGTRSNSRYGYNFRSNGFDIYWSINMVTDRPMFDYDSHARWAAALPFTVDGSGALLRINSQLGNGAYAQLDFELVNETENLTLASLSCSSTQACSGDFYDETALLDGNSYSFTTLSSFRSSTNLDRGPQLRLEFYNATLTFPPAAVPEPSTALLLLLGTLGMGWAIRGQRRAIKT